MQVSRLPLAGGVALLSFLAAACSTLPTSGPTAGQIVAGVKNAHDNTIGMKIVDISPEQIGAMDDQNHTADAKVLSLASLQLGQDQAAVRNDVVGPGDVLAIDVYEVGVGLFAAQRGFSESFDPSARGQNFEAIVVDRNGMISLPYAGRIKVGGLSPAEIEEVIDKAYAGRSQSPQATVTVRKNWSQTVYVTGDVRRPGRIELSLQREGVLAAIADAGGAVSQTQDMVVRVSRGDRMIEERLDRIRPAAADDLELQSGDTIELIKEPQTFTVFGAANKQTQVPFEQTDLTLAEAIARAGGPNDSLANPKSVFLFRFDPAVDGKGPGVPTIYRLNMIKPASYFLAQKFAMRNKDVLYISNAAINRIAKFVAIATQLSSPVVTAKVAADQ